MLKKILAVKQRHKQVKINTPKVKKQMGSNGVKGRNDIENIFDFTSISFWKRFHLYC